MRRRYSAVGITDDRRTVVLFPTETRSSSFHQNIQINFVPTQPPIQGVSGFVSPVKRGRILKLTTHLYSVPRLRIRGTICPFPTCLHVLDRNNSLSHSLSLSLSIYIYIYIYIYTSGAKKFIDILRDVIYVLFFEVELNYGGNV